MSPPPHWHPGPPSHFARARIGLLGGSFNPAHEGHAYIARAALERLALDEVWWLVSPQNPLKGADGMAPLAARLASAAAVADGLRSVGRCRVTDIETALGGPYTAITLARLARAYPRLRFVWLMGADNLLQIPRWRRWPSIFHTVPVAIFARPPYSCKALSGAAAGRFRDSRLPERAARKLARHSPPAWVYLHGRLLAASATAIRARRRELASAPE